MNDDTIDYGQLIDEAMHNIVKKTLQRIQLTGLPGDHHFFISFLTDYPGVMIPDDLRDRYPDEMTIVVQYQFWDLEVDEDRFSIVLSFDNVKKSLTIPFDALTSFTDPSVKFGLQFRHVVEEEQESESPAMIEGDDLPPTGGSDSNDNVVALDSFRNNKKK